MQVPVVRSPGAEAPHQSRIDDCEQQPAAGLILEHVTDLLLGVDPENKIRWVSPSVTKILGWSPKEFLGRTVGEFIHPEDRAALSSGLDNVGRDVEATIEVRARTAPGEYLWMGLAITAIVEPGGNVVGWLGSGHVIQGEVAARDAQGIAQQQLRSIMEAAPVGLALLDLDGGFLQANPALCRIVGRDPSSLLGNPMADILDPRFHELGVVMRQQLSSGRHGTARVEIPLIAGDGSPVWVEHRLSLVRDARGAPHSFASQFVDITQAREGRERIPRLSSWDPQDQVPPRGALLSRVGRMLVPRRRPGDHLGVLLIDVDGPRHAHGERENRGIDQVVADYAKRTAASVRTEDLVVVLGSDEVLVVLPSIPSATDARAVATKLRGVLSRPVDGEGDPLAATARTVHVGISVSGREVSLQEALRRAGRALHQARQAGDPLITYNATEHDTPSTLRAN